MPTIDLTDTELAALTAAIQWLVDEDKFPHAPRLEPLHQALAKLQEAAPGPLAGKNLPHKSTTPKGRPRAS